MCLTQAGFVIRLRTAEISSRSNESKLTASLGQPAGEHGRGLGKRRLVLAVRVCRFLHETKTVLPKHLVLRAPSPMLDATHLTHAGCPACDKHLRLANLPFVQFARQILFDPQKPTSSIIDISLHLQPRCLCTVPLVMIIVMTGQEVLLATNDG